jgi:hypothetical protein
MTTEATPLFCMDSIFVFNSKFAGKKEDEDHYKLLSFFPQSRSQNDKMLLVGLSEGVASFIHNFTVKSEEEHMNIHCMVSDLYLRTFLQPEEGYWLVL